MFLKRQLVLVRNSSQGACPGWDGGGSPQSISALGPAISRAGFHPLLWDRGANGFQAAVLLSCLGPLQSGMSLVCRVL